MSGNEARFRKIVEQSFDVIYEIDQTGHFTYVSPAVTRLTGYSPTEIIDKHFTFFISESGQRIANDKFAEMIAGRVSEGHQFQLLRKDGSAIVVEANYSTIMTNGEIVSILGIIRDITDRNHIRETLHIRNRQYQNFIDNSLVGIWQLNFPKPISIKMPPAEIAMQIIQTGYFSECNNIQAQMYGYSSKDGMIGKRLRDFIVDVNRTIERLVGVIQNHYKAELLDDEEKDNQGRIRYFRNSYFGHVEKDVLLWLWGIQIDITEQKQVAEALRQSETRLRHITDNMLDLISQTDEKGIFKYVSPSYKMLLGYEEKELIGKPIFDLIHPEDLDRVIACFQSANALTSTTKIEFRCQHADGHYICLETISNWLVNERDQSMGVVASSRDVTERKNAEEQVRLLSHTVRSVQDCISITDLEDQIIFVNEAFERTYGYAKEELIGKHISLVRSQIHSDPLVKTILVDTIHGGWQGELWNRRKDGSEFMIWLTTKQVRDELNNTVALVGVARDITERTQAENRIRWEMSRTETLLRMANRLNAELDLKAVFNSVCEETARVLHVAIVNIYLYDDKQDVLYPVAGLGISPKHRQHLPRIQRKLYDKAVQQFGPVFVVPYQQIVADMPKSGRDTGIDIRTFGLVSMLYKGQLIGTISILSVGEDRNFTAAELSLLQGLADQAVLAIVNARLFTEQKLAQEALAAEKERLSVTLRSIGDGVITTNTEGRIIFLNLAAEFLTGWQQKEAVGKSLHEVVHFIDEKNLKIVQDPVTEVLRTGEIVTGENHTILISKEGKKRIIAKNAAPIRDKENKTIGEVLVIRDITDRQKLEEEIVRAQKLESIGILAGGIAHDFNNILSAILGNISLAKMDIDSNKEVYEILSEAEKASLRAKSLTQQLLTFSKGGVPILQTASIAEIIQESTGFALRGANVRCDFSLPADLWAVEVDQGQMSQVIHNLILNSQQAMPAGGIIRVVGKNLTIKKVLDQAEQGIERFSPPLSPGKYVKIAITDSGIGIPKENLKLIFDPYFTTKQMGSGLGLAITYSIIKKHNGYITVDSELGVSSTFTIYLPTSDKKSPPVKISEEQPLSGVGKILLMDDEVIVLKVAGRMLSRLGYQSEFVRDGEAAIAVYLKARDSGSPFAAVIMDLTIPGGMGGKEAIEQLRKYDPQVKAIVSSGYSNDPIMANYAAFGFKGVVAKPYKMNELGDILSQIINS